MSKADMLASALDEFLGVAPEVEAAAVVSADGLPMASALPPHVEEDRLAAMSAALLTLGDRAAAGLGKGELAQVFVEGASGHVILMAAGPDAVLVTVTSTGTKIGLVLFEMRKTATRVGEVMTSSTPVEESHTPAHSMSNGSGYDQAPSYDEPHGYDPAPYEQSSPPSFPDEMRVRAPEPIPAAEVVQPSVSAWE
jgi:predicted regulator of Ras-like GTPase activity (Roadblock/LC7/MglB family)